MRAKSNKVIYSQEYRSPAGVMILSSFDDQLIESDWKEGWHRKAAVNRRQRFLPYPIITGESPVITEAKNQLEEYFASWRKIFDLKLLFLGTQFQQEVWKQLLNINFGKSISYGDLAKAIDRPKAVRAVANAVGANPFSIIVPCHRVLGSSGTITGYGGGYDSKEFLLNHEGVDFLHTEKIKR